MRAPLFAWHLIGGDIGAVREWRAVFAVGMNESVLTGSNIHFQLCMFEENIPHLEMKFVSKGKEMREF